jgi:hypothetical protein
MPRAWACRPVGPINLAYVPFSWSCRPPRAAPPSDPPSLVPPSVAPAAGPALLLLLRHLPPPLLPLLRALALLLLPLLRRPHPLPPAWPNDADRHRQRKEKHQALALKPFSLACCYRCGVLMQMVEEAAPRCVLQAHISNVSDILDVCCKRFIGCCKNRSGCCICCNDCTRMLQKSISNVSSIFQTYVASVFI